VSPKQFISLEEMQREVRKQRGPVPPVAEEKPTFFSDEAAARRRDFAKSGYELGKLGVTHGAQSATSAYKLASGGGALSSPSGVPDVPDGPFSLRGLDVGLGWALDLPEGQTASDALREFLSRTVLEQAARAEELAPDDPSTFEKTISALAGVPPMILEMGAASTVGGLPGLAALIVAKSATKPDTGEFTSPREVAHGTAMGAATLAGLKLAHRSPTIAGQMTRAGGVGAGLAYVEGGEVSDVIAGAAAMAPLGLSAAGRAGAEYRASMKRAETLERTNAADRGLQELEVVGPVRYSRGETPGGGTGPDYVGRQRGGGHPLPPGVAPLKPGKLIGREEILQDLANGLDTPISSGHMGSLSRNVTGFYDAVKNQLRTRRFGDLDTTGHEVGHLIDFRHPEFARSFETPKIRRELERISYEEGNVIEGRSEFMRLWMTRYGDAKERAPGADAAFSRFLTKNPDTYKVLRRAQIGMHRYYAQTALEQAATKIALAKRSSYENAPMPGRPIGVAPRPIDSFIQGNLDDLHGLLIGQKRVFNNATAEQIEQYTAAIGNPVAPYTIARLTRSKHEIAAGVMEFGHPVRRPDGSVAYEGKGFIPIAIPIAQRGELGPWLLYMIGRRSLSLMRRTESQRQLAAEAGKDPNTVQPLEKLFTPEQVMEMVRSGDGKPHWHKAAEEYQELNRGLVKFGVDSHVYTPQTAERMLSYFYIPFYRETMEAPSFLSGENKPSGAASGLRELRGGEANLRDPLQNILDGITRIVDHSITNYARRAVGQMEHMDGSKSLFSRIEPGSKKVEMSTEKLKKSWADAMKLDISMKRVEGTNKWEPSNPADKAIADAAWNGAGDSLSIWQQAATPLGKNIFGYLDEGKPVYLEVAEPLFARAMMAFDRPGPANPRLAAAKNVMQFMITHEPVFVVRNVGRDQILATLFSKYGYTPREIPGALKSMALRDAEYQDFRAAGGSLGRLSSADQMRETISSRAGALRGPAAAPAGEAGRDRLIGTAQRVGQRSVNTAKRAGNAMTDLMEVGEVMTRYGAYRQAGRAHPKMHQFEKAIESKEISTDFQMRGDAQGRGGWALDYAIDGMLFFRPTLDGLYRAARGLTTDQNRARIMKGTALIAGLSAANQFYNHGNPVHDNLSAAQKMMYWHLRPPSRHGAMEMMQSETTNDDLYDTYYNSPSVSERMAAYEEISRRHMWIAIPKVWEVGSVATAAEHMTEGFLSGEWSRESARAAAALARNFHVGTPIPIGDNIEVPFPWLPSVALPPIENFGNWDTFRGANVEPPYMESMDYDPGERFTSRTSPLVRDVGRGVGYSPMKLSHLVEGYTGLWANWGYMLADTMLYGDQGLPGGNPMERAFLKQDWHGSEGHRRYMDAFRGIRGEVNTARKLAEEAELLGEPGMERALRYQEERALSMSIGSGAERALNSMSGVRKFEQDLAMARDEKTVMQFVRGWVNSGNASPAVKKAVRERGADALDLKRSVLEDVRRNKNVRGWMGLDTLEEETEKMERRLERRAQ